MTTWSISIRISESTNLSGSTASKTSWKVMSSKNVPLAKMAVTKSALSQSISWKNLFKFVRRHLTSWTTVARSLISQILKMSTLQTLITVRRKKILNGRINLSLEQMVNNSNYLPGLTLNAKSGCKLSVESSITTKESPLKSLGLNLKLTKRKSKSEKRGKLFSMKRQNKCTRWSVVSKSTTHSICGITIPVSRDTWWSELRTLNFTMVQILTRNSFCSISRSNASRSAILIRRRIKTRNISTLMRFYTVKKLLKTRKCLMRRGPGP